MKLQNLSIFGNLDSICAKIINLDHLKFCLIDTCLEISNHFLLYVIKIIEFPKTFN